MFKVTGIDHIVLKTSDTKKMLLFYCEILGCKVENEQPTINLTQLRAGNNIIDLVEDKNYHRSKSNNLEHFCLRITPFNYEQLKAYFVKHKIEMLRFGHRYGAQGYSDSFYLHDPEGNEV